MAADGDASSEPLKYQTSILKVSIHCHGCKKKVKKLLQGIDGVYKTTIDSQQQKVTVTGNVHSDTLIKKLLKAGKRAELWPEKKPVAPNLAAGATGGGKKIKKKGGGAGAGVPPPDSQEKSQPESEEAYSSSSEDKPNPSNGPASSPQEKLTGEESGEPFSSSSVKKKDNKKKKNSLNQGGTEGKQGNTSPSQLFAPAYHFPAFPTQLPPYILSYNTPQPATCYAGAAHHPVTLQQNSYLYSGHHPANGTYYIPSLGSTPATYDLFSEENANACAVM